MEDFINIFKHVAKENYANFNGRARRREYWMNFLAYIAIVIAIVIAISIVGTIASVLATIMGVVSMIVSLGLVIPTIALVIRRLHDTNKSGWFLLLGLFPLTSFYLLYLLVIEGDKGANQYGEDPKANT